MRVSDLITVCLLISVVTSERQIDTFNILLPQVNQANGGRPIQLINAQGACFQWASSAPEIVAVDGLSDDNSRCLRKGVVSMNHVGVYPTTPYITASNEATDELSNIPVRIKPIVKIAIVSKSRMMNRNQRQDLNVHGYDKDDNQFTSLEGFKFEWQLIENSEILTKISLKNSHLILPLEERKNIEKRGSQSDILVVKGLNPGQAKVKVRCVQPGYEHLEDTITISVHERFDIVPGLPTYLLMGSSFQFGLSDPTGGPISIPKSYYKTTINREFSVTDSLLVQTPQSESFTKLHVEDVRTKPGYFSEVQIYSKIPDQIVINVQDYLIVGEKVKVEVELYWQKRRLNGFTNQIKVSSSSPDFQYDSATGLIQASKRGTSTVKATYMGLVVQKEIAAILPLKAVLASNDIHLPVYESFELKIIGGSGHYEYQMGSECGVISPSGIINAKNEGQCYITVFDKKAPSNRLVINLKVSPLSVLTPLELHKELNKNVHAPIFTQGQSRTREFFTECNEQQIKLEIGHLISFEHNKKYSLRDSLNFLNEQMQLNPDLKKSLLRNAQIPEGVNDFINARFGVYLRGGDVEIQELTQYVRRLENYGICEVHMVKSYAVFDGPMEVYSTTNTNVRGRFQLRVYSEIQNAISGSEDEFTMTPLSSLEWKTTGGSYEWSSESPTQTFINSIEYRQKFPRVSCPADPTTFDIRIQYKNPITSTLLLPVNQTKIIQVHCKFPSELRMAFDQQNINSEHVFGLKGQHITGWVYPLDEKAGSFYNFSNLKYQSQSNNGVIRMNENRFDFDPKHHETDNVLISSNSLQDTAQNFPQVETGFFYEARNMFSLGPQFQNQEQKMLLLYNPRASYDFKIQGASKNIEIACNDSINCQYYENDGTIKLNTTKIGPGFMTIRQRQVFGAPSLTVVFEVVDADLMTITLSQNSVETHREVEASIKLFYSGSPIPVWQYELNDISLVHEPGLRASRSLDKRDTFIVYAEKPGDFNLQAEQHYPKYLESHNSVPLNVFSKFTLNIPNLRESYVDKVLHYEGDLTIAVNCVREMHVNGGPMKFSVDNELQNSRVIEFKSNWHSNRHFHIHALNEGQTKLTVTFKSQSGDRILAVLTLHVTTHPIEGVKIHTLEEALVKAQFRAIAHLIVGGKVILDSKCDLAFNWFSSSEQILKLHSLGSNQAINASALSEGASQITVSVVAEKTKRELFKVSKLVTVHKNLDIELPTVIGERNDKLSSDLLIPPHSGYRFEESISITKISQCEEGLILINDHTLRTTREKGSVNIKLKSLSDPDYSNFLNIIVTEISALFIENVDSKVQLDSLNGEQPVKIKFHVQDRYGRLFHNNLLNVDYEVISSNDDILGASINPSKEHILLEPRKQGEATLVLRLKHGSHGPKADSILEVPHDIVSVHVGRIISPASPIYVTEFGYVDITYHGSASGSWEILSGHECVELDSANHRVTAKYPGEAVLSINGYQATVRVVKFSHFKLIQGEEPGAGFTEQILIYSAIGLWEGKEVVLKSISNSVDGINNRLDPETQLYHEDEFLAQTKVENVKGVDLLFILLSIREDFKTSHNINPRLQWQIVNRRPTGNMQIVNHAEHNVWPRFHISHKYREGVTLTNLNSQKTIEVQSTGEALEVEIHKGENWWYSVKHSQDKKKLIIDIRLDPKKMSEDVSFVLAVKSLETGQQGIVPVKYIANASGQIQQPEREKSEQRELNEAISGQSWLSGWHWTDFLVVIMALTFLLILGYHSCMGDDLKYKQL